jgi:hypothetical protein
MRTLDRIFGWLMTLSGSYLLGILSLIELYESVSGVGHYGKADWTIGDGMMELLLGACNLMRAERPHDRTLARVCVAGNLGWIALAIKYMVRVGLPHGIRVPLTEAIQLFLAAVLLFLSVRTLQRSRPM